MRLAVGIGMTTPLVAAGVMAVVGPTPVLETSRALPDSDTGRPLAVTPSDPESGSVPSL